MSSRMIAAAGVATGLVALASNSIYTGGFKFSKNRMLANFYILTLK